jgi:LysM repeat protein
MLLAVVVACTPRGLAPSPTIGVQTATVMVPSTETPSFTTPTQTLTTTLATNGTSVPTFTPSPTATICATPSNGITYIVQPGDNLNQIALRYNMSAEELQHANCLPSADTIFAGQTIYVPFYLPSVLFPADSVPPASFQTVIPENLKQEIAFDTGGENEVPVCANPTPGVSQQITISERLKDKYELCVYGFPVGEDVTVNLYAPDNHWVAGKNFRIPAVANPQKKIRIQLWMPVGAPTGSWSATAQPVSNQTATTQPTSTPPVKQSFSISQFTEPAINTMPKGEINPFEIEKECGLYSEGEEVVIRGTNIVHNGTLPIGIYKQIPPDSSGKYRLISVQPAVLSQGSFSISVTIQPSDASGLYWVIPVTNVSQEAYDPFDARNDCYEVIE